MWDTEYECEVVHFYHLLYFRGMSYYYITVSVVIMLRGNFERRSEGVCSAINRVSENGMGSIVKTPSSRGAERRINQ